MNSKGYQLLELMMVCSLLGFLSTTGLPLLQGIAEQEKLHAAGQAFRSAVAAARSQAIAKNSAVRIYIHKDRKSFATAGRDDQPNLWQNLPDGVEFSSLPTNLPTFYSRGTASPGGSFILRNSRGELSIIISLTGRTRWERIS